MSALRTRAAFHGMAMALAAAFLLCPPDAAGAGATQCPAGPNKNQTPPAGCPAPSDAQCSDGTGRYSATKNEACAAAWSDHCSCINQQRFSDARTPLSTPNNLERAPSPTKNVFSSDKGNNGVHVRNYGIRTDYLSPDGAPPPVRGARVSTSISGVPAANTTDPPSAVTMTHKANGAKSGKVHCGKPNCEKSIAPGTVAKSKQNTWTAHEVLARAESTNACRGKSGDDLVSCAKAYMRRLSATPPRLGDQICEDFVYNRYYDIERWTDRTNACGPDLMCQATITLDPSDGIAGKLLSGSDLTPANRAAFQKIVDFAFGTPPKPPPNCGDSERLDDLAKKATMSNADELHSCELVRSMPPVAHLHPSYYSPIGGTGTATGWLWNNGQQTQQNSGLCLGNGPCSSVGYWASKNPFYDAGPVISPMVVRAFASDPAKSQSIQRLVADLAKGAQYFYVGDYKGGRPPAGPQKVSYPDEWAFDRASFNATKGVSSHTLHDYAKRREFLRQRVDAFNALFSGAVSGSLKFAIPASAVNGNSLASSQVGVAAVRGGVVQSPEKVRANFPGVFPNPSFSGRLGSLQQVTPPQPTQIEQYAWRSGAPQMDPAYKYPRLLCSAPDQLEAGYSARGSTMGTPKGLVPLPINGPATGAAPTHMSELATATCNYVNAVLDEWARNDSPALLAPTDTNPRPERSGCFANDPACDWDPGAFMDDMRDLVQFQIANVQGARREADYKFCKEWQPVIGKPAAVTTKYGDQHNGEMSLLADMKAEVQGDFSKIADVPVIDHGGTWSAKGPPTGAGGPHPTPWAGRLIGQQKAMQGDSFATFGQDRHNAETWGNDLFGVGYSYDIGWEIPVRWETVSDPNGGTSTAVCDLGVGAHGGFEAFAYAFGSDKFGIISVDLAAGANDYTDPNVPGDPNNVDLDTNLHQAAFNADLTIAGDSLVSENLAGFGAKNVPVAQGSNSWNLFTIPFQITFVTLEISVGVGYSYAVELDATPTHQDTCHQVLKQDHGPWPKPNPPQPSVGLTAALHPQGNLDGIVQAYASLAGLAGVGIQVNLTLLGIGLPLDNTLKLEPNKLTLASSLNMDFQTLDGSLSVYAEALFFQLFDIEIISWSGMHDKIPLLNTDTHVDIGALSGLGLTGLTNPAASLAGL